MANRRSRARELGVDPISFTLERRRRRTIAIHVSREGSVRVLAPTSTPEAAVEAFVESKGPWIARKLQEFATLPAPEPVAYTDGEALPYLGGTIRLRTFRGRGAATLGESGELLVPVRSGATERTVHRKVNEWYLVETRRLCSELVGELTPRAARIGIPGVKGVEARRMRRRWGSCLPGGIIMLNSELLGAPRGCVEYVVAHELCHLREANHGRRFYALMDELVPDWKELRRRLNREAPLGFLEPPAT
ncbi:MAG: M48 family metallopeptidase [Spirochaetaceae bacterium]